MRQSGPQSHNFSAIAAACAINMSTLGELPSEASRSVHRAHVSLDCGMRSAPLPPIPSLVRDERLDSVHTAHSAPS